MASDDAADLHVVVLHLLAVLFRDIPDGVAALDRQSELVALLHQQGLEELRKLFLRFQGLCQEINGSRYPRTLESFGQFVEMPGGIRSVCFLFFF